MPTSVPLVTTAMPVCNAERTIGHAVKSILLQAYENGEAFVIDDDSTDRILSILSSFAEHAFIRL